MDFQIQGAVYKQSDEDNKKRFKDYYDETKRYPTVRGELVIKRDEIDAICQYLQQCKNLPDLKEYKFSHYSKEAGKNLVESHVGVPLEVNGYTGNTKENVPMVSMKSEKHWLMKKMIAEQEERLASSANNLAKTTAGTVIQTQQDSIF